MSPILFLIVFAVAAVLVIWLVQTVLSSLKVTDPVRVVILIVAVGLLLLWLLEHFNLVPAL